MSYTKEDILKTARDLHFYPTEEKVQEILDRLEGEIENDPAGNLELWIENLLYSVESRQEVPSSYEIKNQN